MREIRELREERQQMRAEFEAQLRERDGELRHLEESLQREWYPQLSSPNNRARDADLNLANLNSPKLGFKLKPDNYDGSAPLREFELIARANEWNDSHKTVALAACLRNKARLVLDRIFEIENLRFEDLKSKLELRFGEGHLVQSYYSQFTNRKQNFGGFGHFGRGFRKAFSTRLPRMFSWDEG